MERGRPMKPGCFRPIGRGSPPRARPPPPLGFTVNMQDSLDLSGLEGFFRLIVRYSKVRNPNYSVKFVTLSILWWSHVGPCCNDARAGVRSPSLKEKRSEFY